MSIGIHTLLITLFVVGTVMDKKIPPEVLNFSVVEKFKVAPETKAPVLKIQKPKVTKTPIEKKRKVYGLNRKSITQKDGVQSKQGNTLAKTPDKLTLNKDDADSIPIPADEFLISCMPKVTEEIRPKYPENQKKLGKEGNVIFEIIIGPKGLVREAILIKSLGADFDQAAKEASIRFKFRPAMIYNKPVAVKIKYSINFVLEK